MDLTYEHDLNQLVSAIGAHMREDASTPLDFIPIAEPELGEAELRNLVDAYASTWISSIGKYISAFEEKFSAYCGMQYGVSTSNGTTALHLALAALGIGPGDEVIVPDITFASTVNAVLYVGATPVIVDIERDSWCIDPVAMEAAITSRTRAVIPVHIYGQACDMSAIMALAKKHHLYVVEDCAEAHGAEYNGQRVGSFGIINCFSFFGNKVITSGEGGMCLTNDPSLNEKMRVLRDHGMNKKFKYYHDAVGFNYRMTNMQAAIGLAQLENIDHKLAWRSALEMQYAKETKDIPGFHLQTNDLPNRKKVTWLVTAYLDDADKREPLMAAMREARIDARPFFIPLDKMDVYKPYAKACPVSHDMSLRGFNLPTSARIRTQEMKRIMQVLHYILG